MTSEKDDKPVSKGGFTLDIVDEGVASQVSLNEEYQKAYAVRKYQIGEPCPRNLGDENRDKREIDPAVAQSYPKGQQVTDPYTHQTPTHKIRLKWQDGHHPANRDDLVNAQIGSEAPAHEHDDWKRSPGEVADQDPEKSQVGDLAKYRVPEWSGFYSAAPGDELHEAKKPKNRVNDITGPGD
jgi:hypothetical protein